MTDVSEQLKPSSATEVSAAVIDAIAGGYGLSIGRGQASNQKVHALCLGNMQTIIDYPARDMTITVQAGMGVSELRKVLQQENQQLPIDCHDLSMSVGALVASDTAGPRQFGYGTLRDYVIGIEAVDGQGRIFHAGGRVVKNVAGYDLCRLLVGSRGALGVITQVTFKLKPLPEHSMLRTFSFDSASNFERSLECLNTTSATPVVLDFMCAPAELAAKPTADAGPDIMSLTIGVEGSVESCEWQLAQLRTDCIGAKEVADGSTDRSIVEQLGQSSCDVSHGSDVILRTVPSQVAPIAAVLAEAGLSCQGHAGTGIICVSGTHDSTNVRAVCENLTKDRHATVFQWDVDHPAKNASPLSARLRDTFDPHRIFAATTR